jgi:hypothetical protein
MDEKKAQEIINDLNLTMQGLGLETSTSKNQGGSQMSDTLLVAFPMYDEDNLGLVAAMSDEQKALQTAVLEVMLLRYDEDERFCFQFFTTLLHSFSCEPAELEHLATEINFFCPIGGFVVMRAQKQFIHKYGLLFDEGKNVNQIATTAMMAIEAIADMVDAYYDVSVAVGSGEQTVDGLVRDGKLHIQG